MSDILAGQPGRSLPSKMECIVSRPLGGRLVLYNPASREVSVLNATAAAVWELCDGRTLVSDAAARLRQRFHVGESRDVDRDVEGVLRTLTDRGLLCSSGVAASEEPAG